MMRFVLTDVTTGGASLVEPWWAIVMIAGVVVLGVCAVMAEGIRR